MIPIYKEPTALVPCPFCGFQPDIKNEDCIYPINRERTVWTVVCYETGGGCGAEMTGYNRLDCLDKWNRRT